MINIQYIIKDDGFETVYCNKEDQPFIKLSDNYQYDRTKQISANQDLNQFLNYLEQSNYEQYKTEKVVQNLNLITFHNLNDTQRQKYLPFYNTIICLEVFYQTIYVQIFNRKETTLYNYILGEYLDLSNPNKFKDCLEKNLQITIISQKVKQVRAEVKFVQLYAAYLLSTVFKGEGEINNITIENIQEFIQQNEEFTEFYRLKSLAKQFNYKFMENQSISISNNFEQYIHNYIKYIENSQGNDLKKKLIMKYFIKRSNDQIQLSSDNEIIVNLFYYISYQSQYLILISKNKINQLINVYFDNIMHNYLNHNVECQIKNSYYNKIDSFNKQVDSIKYLLQLIEKIWQKQDLIEQEDLEIDLNQQSESVFYFPHIPDNKNNLVLVRNDIDQCLVLKFRQFFYGKLDDDFNFVSGVKTEQSVDENYNYSYSDSIGQFKDDQIIQKEGFQTQFKTNLDFNEKTTPRSDKKISPETQQQNQPQKNKNYKNIDQWARFNQLFNDQDIYILQNQSQRFLNSSILDGWGIYLNQQNDEKFFNLSIIEAKKFRRLLIFESFFYTYLEAFEQCGDDIKIKFSEFIKFKIDIFDVYQNLCFIINKKGIHWFMIKAEIYQNIVIYTIYDSMFQQLEYYRKYTEILDKNFFTKVLGKTYSTLGQVAFVERQKDGYSCGYHVCYYLEQIHEQQTKFDNCNIKSMKEKLLKNVVQSDQKK